MNHQLEISFELNGKKERVKTSPNRRLLDLLREDYKLTGVKEGCGEGECGACTIILDGEAVNSCLVLVPQVDGSSIFTIEGLSDGYRLHPIQEAFINCGAVQCGFCIPGMILSAKVLIDKHPNPTEEEIKTSLSGNLCRCTGYQKIIEAVRQASKYISAGMKL